MNKQAGASTCAEGVEEQTNSTFTNIHSLTYKAADQLGSLLACACAPSDTGQMCNPTEQTHGPTQERQLPAMLSWDPSPVRFTVIHTRRIHTPLVKQITTNDL